MADGSSSIQYLQKVASMHTQPILFETERYFNRLPIIIILDTA